VGKDEITSSVATGNEEPIERFGVKTRGSKRDSLTNSQCTHGQLMGTGGG